ncbi:hypothetical protein MNEG_4567 [Monoraphidium neglectum]|jgi:hypothetical protein|uniref:PUB domain-containing protein n=1 Tax=Monoraphidium neglectum TaxID=145388 RepID=A0A0D2NDK0_9CHLO|nr:hypothetical protein MNEG_4567 [Monoraphidium neglectum]KIZ03396.1 hypothetical protein MNEG_4567 [Monoraphidium neglectum]|eukprot:XP_013902415.1 hypothetical protein MNEG_4567 [Monoraphidium neglectum]
MGYAGYVSAKYPPPKPTEVEAAVQAVKSEQALDVIGKLLYNAAISPREEKFRRIKLTNAKIRESIVEAHGALDALRALGWVDDPESSEYLVVQPGLYFSMKEVRVVEAAKEKLRKDARGSNKNLAGMVSVQA